MPTNKFIPVKSLIFAAGCLAAGTGWLLRAQVPTPSPAATPDAVIQSLPQLPDSVPSPGAAATPAGDATPNLTASPAPSVKRGPTVEPGDPTLNTNNSFWLDSYPLNDLYQYLARQASYQFFQNPYLDPIKVTGELFKGRSPIDNMRELALQYNLVLFRKGQTLYALTQDQIATLPQQDYRYELKYLHPKPEDIQRMLGHFLTKDRGSASLEPQINTIVVSDNETVIPKIARYLQSIDVPRRQISILVRVISLTTSGDKRTGIDWSQTLGAQGLAISASAQSNLDAAFGFRPSKVSAGTSTSTTAAAVSLPNEGTNVILGPIQVTAVLRALYDNTRAHEESAPLVITEDNQASTVRVVTRQPIITSTVTSTTAGPDIANDVRYFLDPSDVPKNREIGTTLLVTPSILPDKTIRLQIDGTVATVVSQVTATTGTGASAVTNSYPVVNEAHLVNLSRVPSGYSLILGGFVTINNSTQNNKIPLLSSIPLVGAAFRSKQISHSRTNLAFIITPIAFQAANPEQSIGISNYDRANLIGPEHNLEDPDLIGRANVNATDFRNALSNGQFEDSDKNPVNRQNSVKKRNRSKPQSESMQDE